MRDFCLQRNSGSTSARHLAMKVSGSAGIQQEPQPKENYELEKILHRVHRSVCFHLRFWIHLVREVDAWRASTSACALAARSRVWQLFRVADLRTRRDGVLSYTAVREICSWRWRGRLRGLGHFGSAG